MRLNLSQIVQLFPSNNLPFNICNCIDRTFYVLNVYIHTIYHQVTSILILKIKLKKNVLDPKCLSFTYLNLLSWKSKMIRKYCFGTIIDQNLDDDNWSLLSRSTLLNWKLVTCEGMNPKAEVYDCYCFFIWKMENYRIKIRNIQNITCCVNQVKHKIGIKKSTFGEFLTKSQQQFIFEICFFLVKDASKRASLLCLQTRIHTLQKYLLKRVKRVKLRRKFVA